MAKLMAPGGTKEMALLALEAGADAVYLGAMGWSRRPPEDELTDDELHEVYARAKELGKEVKLALNTLPGPKEIPLLLKKIEKYVGWGCSSFIMNDAGCIHLVRNRFPHVDIHASVTCAVANREDVRFYRQVGATFVILSYRWGVDVADIRAIKQEVEVGVETFLFQPLQRGIICPGKCTMSSFFKFDHQVDAEGKDHYVGSSNRGGSCHRVCQAGWRVSGQGQSSPKQIPLKTNPSFVFWEIPDYIKAGVDYLKLPGREHPEGLMRDMTRFYRKVLDEAATAPDGGSLHQFVPEWEELKKRWVSERGRRDRRRLSKAAVPGVTPSRAVQTDKMGEGALAERPDLLHLEDVREGDLALVGGKALNLGLMAKVGLPGSRGFVITTSAFRKSVRSPSAIQIPEPLKEEILAAYREGGFQRVAVRSSATLEDLSQASFAGIYTSSLNVGSEEDLLRGIEACYRSLWTPMSDSYTSSLKADGLGMAVIVQAMVEAKAAGVMYTLDPVTLRSEEFLINSVFGLGEPLVAGRVSGDLFRVDRSGRLINQIVPQKSSMLTWRGEVSLPESRKGQPSLTLEQISSLVKYGKAVEALFGSPQDIEFAIAEEGIALLQARPITLGRESLDVKIERYRRKEIERLRKRIAELRRKNRLTGSEVVFSSGNIGELLPTPTPMSFGLFFHIFAQEGGIQLGRRRLGYVLGDETSEGLFELICGHPYFNLEIDAKTFSIGIPLDIQGYIDAIKVDPQRAIYPELGLYEQEWSLEGVAGRCGLEAAKRYHERFVEFFTGMLKQGRAYRCQFSKEVEPHLQRYLEEERRIQMTTLSNEEIVDKIRAYLEHLRTFSCLHFVIAARLGFFFTERVKIKLSRFFPGEGQTLVGELLRGLEGSKITQQAIDLERLLQGAISREEFLSAYGHLASNELEISLPRLADDPCALDRIAGQFNGSGRDPLRAFREQARRRKRAEEEINGRLAKAGVGRETAEEFFRELRLAQQYLSLRETIKYYFAAEYALIGRALAVLAERLRLCQADLFYLYPSEVPELLTKPHAAKAKVEQRKEERRLALTLAKRKGMPKVIFESALQDIGRAPKIEALRELYGMPVSSGEAVGTVRILDLDAPCLTTLPELGTTDVIVVRAANLGMFLMIRKAAGLIMETGGLLAHGACLARESGIAAVVLENATALLSNGSTVHVDGNSGKVCVLQSHTC